MIQNSIGGAKTDCVKPAYTPMLVMVKTKSLRLLVSIISVTAARVETQIGKHQMKVKSDSTLNAPQILLCKNTSNITESAFSELPSTLSLSRSIRRWRQVKDSIPPIPQERHGY